MNSSVYHILWPRVISFLTIQSIVVYPSANSTKIWKSVWSHQPQSVRLLLLCLFAVRSRSMYGPSYSNSLDVLRLTRSVRVCLASHNFPWPSTSPNSPTLRPHIHISSCRHFSCSSMFSSLTCSPILALASNLRLTHLASSPSNPQVSSAAMKDDLFFWATASS